MSFLSVLIVLILQACATAEDPQPSLFGTGSQSGVDAGVSPDGGISPSEDAGTSVDAGNPGTDAGSNDAVPDIGPKINCQSWVKGQPGTVKALCANGPKDTLIWKSVQYNDDGCEVVQKDEPCACGCSASKGCLATVLSSPFMGTADFGDSTKLKIGPSDMLTKGDKYHALMFDHGPDASPLDTVIGSANGTPSLVTACIYVPVTVGSGAFDGTDQQYPNKTFQNAPVGTKVNITAGLAKANVADCQNCVDTPKALKIYSVSLKGNKKPEYLDYEASLDLQPGYTDYAVYLKHPAHGLFVCREAGISNQDTAVDYISVEIGCW